MTRRGFTEVLGETKGSTVLCAAPLFHILGLLITNAYLANGGTVVLPKNNKPNIIAGAIADNDVTDMVAVGAIYLALEEVETFEQEVVPRLMKMDLLGEALGAPSVSAFVSYTGNRTLGDLDPYVDEFYCVTGAVGAEIIVEINCLNHSFYISVMQNFSSSIYVDELVREFAEEGIGYEVVGTDDQWISGTRYDDID